MLVPHGGDRRRIVGLRQRRLGNTLVLLVGVAQVNVGRRADGREAGGGTAEACDHEDCASWDLPAMRLEVLVTAPDLKIGRVGMRARRGGA